MSYSQSYQESTYFSGNGENTGATFSSVSGTQRIGSAQGSYGVGPGAFVTAPALSGVQVSQATYGVPSLSGVQVAQSAFAAPTLSGVQVNSGAFNAPNLTGVSQFSGATSAWSTGSNSTANQVAADLLALSGNASQSNAVTSISVTNSSYQGAHAGYLSEIESAILRSTAPININETEEITVLGQRGVWANKAEVVNWRGVIPITEYQINEDPNPEIITKRTQQNLTYIQELAVRYLRPPTPPAPGEIVITQEANTFTPPAPPLIIRQQPARPSTPEPLVIREAPPAPPAQVGRKVITISGKRLPPPPRKVIIERLAPLPSKPQAVLIERWLPYSQVKRRVIFQRSNERDPVVVKPRNVIVQWEAPQVVIKKDFKYLGIIRANPVEYVQRYGSTLKTSRELPDFVLEIKPPQGVVLAADYQYNQVHELEGDVHALKLVDLEREGLAEYSVQLQKLGISYQGASSSYQAESNLASTTNYSSSYSAGGYTSGFNNTAGSIISQPSSSSALPIIAELFSQVDRDANGRISVEESEKLLLRLNSRLGRRYGEDDVKRFIQSVDVNKDGSIDFNEFRAVLERVL